MASEDFRQTATVVPSPPPTSAEAKALLRAEARQRRRAFVAALDDAERDRQEQALADVLAPWIAQATVAAGYAPMGSEIDPARALRWAGNHGVPIAFPAFTSKTSPMLFRSGHCAAHCPVGGVQPPQQAKAIVPDLVLVPLLAVDRRGTRLGQGGGHYDRTLPALRAAGARIVGIGWAMQLVDGDLPTDPWDVPLDGFASPEGVTMWR